ncbi:MAG TPA: hypothetical protein PLY93_01285 [Turneriella sp.]|nr:hypothetical protein [Turneriella sp.]
MGCGWGEFTRALAGHEKETLFIALEKKLGRILSSARVGSQQGISNIRYMVLDVQWFFSGVFTDATFDAVFINFPDPWPKKRHHKHRFITSEFAEELVRITSRASLFTFATDNYAYAREVCNVFEKSPSWQNTVGAYLAVDRIPQRPVSFFESIHRNEGAPIYILRYKKIELR